MATVVQVGWSEFDSQTNCKQECYCLCFNKSLNGCDMFIFVSDIWSSCLCFIKFFCQNYLKGELWCCYRMPLDRGNKQKNSNCLLQIINIVFSPRTLGPECVLSALNAASWWIVLIVCQSGQMDGQIDTKPMHVPVWFSLDIATVIMWSQQTHHSNNNNNKTRLMALCPGLPGWAGTRRVKPTCILLKQETVIKREIKHKHTQNHTTAAADTVKAQ